jgi:hypothetical protein
LLQSVLLLLLDGQVIGSVGTYSDSAMHSQGISGYEH